MLQLRPVAVMVVGTLLIAACGAGRTAPEPTATPAPNRTVSQSPASQSQAPPVTGSPGPAGQAPPAIGSPGPAAQDPAASPSANAVVPASTEWAAEAGSSKLSGGTALLDVAATGPRDAWAVGYQDSAEDREGTPAILRWDGSHWRQVPLGEADAYHLEGVSAGGPDDVWVVGNGSSPFAAHWNGRAWTTHRPFGVAEDYRLADVATSGGTAWFAANGPAGAVVVEWRDGAFHNALSIEKGTLEAITFRKGHVWVVGTDEARTPLVWHGAGESWEETETPRIPGGRLNRVWQVSPTEVWAVGEISTAPGPRPEVNKAQPLVMRWDGSRWTRVEVPVSRGVLQGVTASGPGDLWISGIDADHAGQVLILHFDGTTWSREYGPLFRAYTATQQYDGTDDIGGTGLTRVPGTDALWAVGSVGTGDDERAFVLRR
ncbi:hypothetical protein OG884_07080 [Streptosporangium sp. NBC_01755]|uniref:hypothetical protein n=1 Tax=unclassified Streptosporangium TaxID=2632669 RepID=UPI002DDA7AFD|nr:MULTISPECIES: hypothetical protein [unclassified Streptosporangium]WSA26895.1 hypothetical protein OIE13_03070 [Streptosporangium sp. NBC_01810]WSD01680.1 hypothetical protein OG884_07080 [Streptosporangium sp. NBC_01755]